MKNPTQIIKSIIRKLPKSEQQIALIAEKFPDTDTNVINDFENKMIEPSGDERFQKKREEWINEVKGLMILIILDFMPIYYPGRKIYINVDRVVYNDEYGRDTYESPVLKIGVDDEVFEFARSRGRTALRDRYYSMSSASNHNGRYAHFQKASDGWWYTTLNNDSGWKRLTEDGFRILMSFIRDYL